MKFSWCCHVPLVDTIFSRCVGPHTDSHLAGGEVNFEIHRVTCAYVGVIGHNGYTIGIDHCLGCSRCEQHFPWACLPQGFWQIFINAFVIVSSQRFDLGCDRLAHFTPCVSCPVLLVEHIHCDRDSLECAQRPRPFVPTKIIYRRPGC